MVGKFGVDGNEEALGRTTKEPIDDTVVGRRTLAEKPVLSLVNAFDFELFTGGDAILRSYLCGEHKLSLG